jgi:exosortase
MDNARTDLLPKQLDLARPTPAWRWLGVITVVLALGVLYLPTLGDLVEQWWEDPNYSHGFLVPFFSAFLVWKRREAVRRALVGVGSWFGFVVLLAGASMLIVGQVGAENFLSRSSFIVVIAGLVLFHYGWPLLRVLRGPLLFLFFMIPLPSILFYAVAFPLQNIAARNAAWALDVLGVPVLLDGNVIYLTNLALGVTEACSGIRSLISLLALAVAWAYVSLPRRPVALLFVATAIPITILANAARVVATGLIGQWFGVHYAQGVFHSFSGWIIFLFAFACLLGVQAVIRTAAVLTRRVR